MPKVCPNCHEEFDSKFKLCPMCGSALVDMPESTGATLNLGDANAISGGLTMSDNHSVSHNTVNTSTNTVDSHNIINNHITHVEREKHPEEIRRENIQHFRTACQDVFADGIQTSEEKRHLDELKFRLGLDDETAAHIIDDVRAKSVRKSTTLGPVQQITFNNIKSAIRGNKIDMVMRLLPQLRAIVRNFAVEEVQYTYYMLQAILKPEDCVSGYCDMNEDKYWQSFWASVAYRKLGEIEESENVLAIIGERWNDTIPQDNTIILATINSIIDGDMDFAKAIFESLSGNAHSLHLETLVGGIYGLIYPDIVAADEDAKKMFEEGSFYVDNLFTKAKASLETKRKTEEEARHKAEEEIKRKKADEDARIKAEREEKLKREEDERVRKDQEEQRKREEDGKAEFQFEQGKCYYEGKGVPKDLKKAVEWFTKAAEHGHSDAQNLLGYFYYTGEGVNKDYQIAINWYRKAADQGNADAQKKLDEMSGPKFCNKCGNPLSPGQTFCNKCGNKIALKK